MLYIHACCKQRSLHWLSSSGMGDPWSIVPYNNDYPYDFPLPDNSLDFHYDPVKFPPTDLPGSFNVNDQNAIFQGKYPNLDQPIQDTPMVHIPHQNRNFEAGQGSQDTPMGHLPHQDFNFGMGPSLSSSQPFGQGYPNNQECAHSQGIPDVVQLPNSPQNSLPFLCSCCQILREIIYTNGIQLEKLEIHGIVGVISHGIVRSGNRQGRIVDFNNKSLEEIKKFIKQYCEEKISAGYFTVRDPLSNYYETLCVGMEWNNNVLDDDLLDSNNSGGASDKANKMDRTTRASLMAQRKRVGKIKLSDFSDVFHLPIEEAARLVNLCPTVVKKICRKQGLSRWPHRKLKSIERKLGVLRESLKSENQMGESKARAEAEIERLYHEAIKHCGGIVPTSLNFNA